MPVDEASNDDGAQDPRVVRAALLGWLDEHRDEGESLVAIGDQTELLGSGVVDSFLMLEMLEWIDERFGVFVDFAEGDGSLTQFGALANHVAALVGAREAA